MSALRSRARRHAGGSMVPAHQAGAALLEALLAASLLGSLALAILEWQYARQFAHLTELALHAAARAGAVDQARPATIQAAFERHMRVAAPPTPAVPGEARLHARWQRTEQDTGLPAWQIEQLAPGPADWRDHAAGASGAAAQTLAFYYQSERHARNLQRGWPQGAGPHSGRTVYQANQLHLRLHYLHRPLSPIARAVLRQLAARWQRAADPYQRQALQAGYWLLRQEVMLPMNSPARQWSTPEHATPPAAALPPPTPRSSAPASSRVPPAAATVAPADADAPAAPPAPAPPSAPSAADATGQAPPGSMLPPLCVASACCAPPPVQP